MKRSLHVKVWILLAYVLVCTALVLLEQRPDVAAPADTIGARAADHGLP
jgi:hypothetical protein